jgi:hypothetical protein
LKTIGGGLDRFFEAKRVLVYMVDGSHKRLYAVYDSAEKYPRPWIDKNPILALAARWRVVLCTDPGGEARLCEGRIPPDWPEIAAPKKIRLFTGPVCGPHTTTGMLQIVRHPDASEFAWKDEQLYNGVSRAFAALFDRPDNLFLGRRKYYGLVDRGRITGPQLNMALEKADRRKLPAEKVLSDMYDVAKEDIGRSLAEFYDLPFSRIGTRTRVPGCLFYGLSLSEFKRHRFFPLGLKNGKILIAVSDPMDREVMRSIHICYRNKPIQPVLVLEEELDRFLGFLEPETDAKDKENEDFLKDLDLLLDLEE